MIARTSDNTAYLATAYASAQIPLWETSYTLGTLCETVGSGNLLSATSHILTKERSKNIIIKGSNNESI